MSGEKKKLHIFLASSVTEQLILEDRRIINEFISILNEKISDKQCMVALIRCDDNDHIVYALEGAQNILDNDIRKSDLFLLLIGERVGEFSIHEYEVARDSFRESEHPRLAVYFRQMAAGPGETVQEFYDMLEKEGYYGNNYPGSADLIGSLAALINELLDLKLICSRDDVSLDGQLVVNIPHVIILTRNEYLANMEQEYFVKLKEYYDARSRLMEEPDNEQLRIEYGEVAEKVEKLKNDISEQRRRILEVQDASMENTTKLQQDAKKAFIDGKTEKALAMLDFGAISKKMDDLGKRLDRERTQMEQYIRELLMRIKFLRAGSVTDDVIDEIIEIYDKAYEIASAYHLDDSFTLEQLKFMMNKRGRMRAERSRKYLGDRLNKKVLSFTDIKYIYHYAGGLNQEKQYEAAIDALMCILSSPYNEESDEEMFYMAKSLLACAVNYNRIDKGDEAVSYAIRAEELYNELERRDHGKYGFELAIAYSDLGYIYNHSGGRKDLAEEYYRMSLKVKQDFWQETGLEVMEMEDTDVNIPASIALSQVNLSAILSDQGKYEETEELLLSSIEIRERRYLENPFSTEAALANSYKQIAKLYLRWGKYELCREYLEKGERCYLRLKERDHSGHSEKMAYFWNICGDYYNAVGDTVKAISYYNEALTSISLVERETLTRDQQKIRDKAQSMIDQLS